MVFAPHLTNLPVPSTGGEFCYSLIQHSSRLCDVGWEYQFGWLLPGIGIPGVVLPSLPGLGGVITSFSRH